MAIIKKFGSWRFERKPFVGVKHQLPNSLYRGQFTLSTQLIKPNYIELNSSISVFMLCSNLPLVCLSSWYFPLFLCIVIKYVYNVTATRVILHHKVKFIQDLFSFLFLISGHLVHLVTLDVSHNNIASIPRGSLLFPAFFKLNINHCIQFIVDY